MPEVSGMVAAMATATVLLSKILIFLKIECYTSIAECISIERVTEKYSKIKITLVCCRQRFLVLRADLLEVNQPHSVINFQIKQLS